MLTYMFISFICSLICSFHLYVHFIYILTYMFISFICSFHLYAHLYVHFIYMFISFICSFHLYAHLYVDFTHRLTISGIMINKNYPAEHPMASHQSRFAVFPNFESADDPRTGNKARAADIKDPEMAANNWNIGVIKKIKGRPVNKYNI